MQHVRWGNNDVPVGVVLVWFSGEVEGGTAPTGPGVADWLSCGWGGAKGTGPGDCGMARRTASATCSLTMVRIWAMSTVAEGPGMVEPEPEDEEAGMGALAVDMVAASVIAE